MAIAVTWAMVIIELGSIAATDLTNFHEHPFKNKVSFAFLNGLAATKADPFF